MIALKFFFRAIFVVLMPKKFTLGKKERLKSRKQIEQLFVEGKKLFLPPFRVHYLVTPCEKNNFPLQFGAGVSGKIFKRAVDRNRIKRLIKESYRQQKNKLQENLQEKKMGMNLFLIYTAKEAPSFKTVEEKVNLILSELMRVADENIS